MRETRMRGRWGLAALLLVGVAGLSSGQTFRFSSDPDELKDARESLQVRPNTPEVRYLFVANPTNEKKTYRVELRDEGRGKALLGSGIVRFKKAETLRVKLEKPAPPPPPKVAVVVPPPKDPAAPPPPPVVAVVEPPPGVALKRAATNDYRFRLRLLEEDGEPALDAQRNPIESVVRVELRQPYSYIEDPTITITRENDARELLVKVKSRKEFSGPPAVVELVFPPQPFLRTEALRGGVYRRTIERAEQTVTLQAKDLPVIPGESESVKFYVSVDGFARAFVYNPDFRRPTEQGLLDLVRQPEIFVLPLNADRPALVIAARPAEKTPVRVLIENAPADAKVAVRLDRSGTGTFTASDEFTILESSREEHAYVDAAGEGEALVVNYRVGDWVHFLDTRALRGRYELQGVMLDKNGKPVTRKVNGSDEEVKYSTYLILDDTPPEELKFGKLPEKHVKGTPLPVVAFARERETSVKQAVFFLGEPAADGKLPDVKVVGDLTDVKQGLWVGRLPIPDKKGTIIVGVQFVNETGIAATMVQKVELIDPPPPPTTGTIAGVVDLGGRPQPKISVVIRDADGKEKGAEVTTEKGEFRVEGLAPGAYTVSAAKPDSGVGTSGRVAAQVNAGKVTLVTVPLARRP